MAYTTLEDLKAYMKTDRQSPEMDTDDSLLEGMIIRAQTRIETYCRTRFEAAADTTREFDCTDLDYGGGDIIVSEDGYGWNGWTSSYTQLGAKYRTRLWFDQPLAQLTSVTMDGETIPSADYRLDPRNDLPAFALLFTDLISTFSYETTIQVAGRWAHSITPPPDIVHAAIRLAAYYFEMRKAPVYDTLGSADFGGERMMPRSEPQDVMHLLMPYRFSPIR